MIPASLLSLLALPLLAAAAPTASAPVARAEEAATTKNPALALENAFRDIRKQHKASKAAAAGDVSALGDIFGPDAPTNVVVDRNELIEGKCAPIIVVFGRGTTEPGNVGDDVGPFFFDELAALEPGRSIVQGVNDYPASIWDYIFGGSNSGADNMAKSVERAASQCPGSKVILSGFSQGAQVVHKAADQIPTNLRGVVGGILMFGDPYNGDSFPGTLNNHVKTFCHEGDLICDGLPFPGEAHSTYENDAPEAAAWVKSLGL